MLFQIQVVDPPTGPICDFCSSPAPGVYADYPAESFVHDVIDDIEVASSDHWAACRTCSDLIDADRWKDLLDRCEELFIRKHGYLPAHGSCGAVPAIQSQKIIDNLSK